MGLDEFQIQIDKSADCHQLHCFQMVTTKLNFNVGTVLIHNRKFRNNLEHYDERLKRWIGQYGTGATIGTYNVGPKSAFKIPNIIYISHYDPTDKTFTFVNEDFDLGILYNEVQGIKAIADAWVRKMQAGIIKPPFS